MQKLVEDEFEEEANEEEDESNNTDKKTKSGEEEAGEDGEERIVEVRLSTVAPTDLYPRTLGIT